MKFSRVFLLTALFILGAAQTVLAYTSDDYYQAGKKLYSVKNYDQAVKYFAAALKLDPNNAGALQARANCYYISGQYQNALDDYQKVLALNPSNTQLANFVEQVKAKVGGASTTTPASPVNSNGSYTQGVALFQQKQYAQAIPYFEQATQQDPRNAKIYYYLGFAQLMAGDKRSATLNLALSNELSPNPSVEAYVKKLRAGLSSDDQQWVDANLSGWTGHGPRTNSEDSKMIGLRLEPGIGLVALGDFNTNDQTRINIGKYLQQNGDPSFQFNGTVPAGYPDITFEPTLKLLPFLEIGLPFTAALVGNSNYVEQDAYSSYNVAYSLSAFAVGLNARVFYGDGPVKLFAAAGPVIMPVSLSYNETDTFPGFPNSTITYSGNSSSTAVGGQGQVGADLHLGGGFLISAYAGYRAASASGFTSTVIATQNGVSTSYPGQQYVVTIPSYGSEILFIPNANLSSYSTTTYRPLTVDLSSVLAGFQVSLYF